MHAKKNLLWLYLFFLLIIIAQSTWWLIFIERQGDDKAEFQLHRLELDLRHAQFLLAHYPTIRSSSDRWLEQQFPNLIFDPGGEVIVDPTVKTAILDESHRTRHMFLWEGGFFLCLLMAGASLVYMAYRRERDYLQARELFLAGVTHEFKTPLASLSLYRETLIRPDLNDEKRESILGNMARDLERLQQMVEQILVVSRTGHTGNLRLEAIDVDEVITQVLDDMEQLIKQQGATVTCELDRVPPVRADRHALATALRNLLTNALAYSMAPAKIRVKLHPDRKQVRLTVSDNGFGISRRERKKIFQSFYRVGESDRRPPGTHGSGLGLYLTRRYLREMGGRIELRSNVGKGSDFTMILRADDTARG